jgi:hypothetical protein
MARSKPKPKPKHKLRHWFLPHAHNDHRPHLIRAHGLAVVALLILGVQTTAYALRPPAIKQAQHGHVLSYASNITPVDLLGQTNQQRTAAGLPALRLDAHLNSSATMKALDMFSENYWAHVSPSGVQPWYWFGKAGYAYSYAGENLAMNFDTTSGVMDGWMNSPGHRANILDKNYVDVGFAVQNGILLGQETTLVVAHYGSPGVTTVAAPAPPATTPKPAVRAAAAPQPTPAVSVEPTPTLTPSPSPALTPSQKPVAASALGSASPSAPATKDYSLFMPLSLSRTLNWATIVTLLLLLVLLIVYVITHLTVWRKGLSRWETKHYKLFASLQIAGLTSLILLIAGSGFGSVG